MFLQLYVKKAYISEIRRPKSVLKSSPKCYRGEKDLICIFQVPECGDQKLPGGSVISPYFNAQFLSIWNRVNE